MRSSVSKRRGVRGLLGSRQGEPDTVSAAKKKPRLVLELDESLKQQLQPSVGRGYAGVLRALIVDAYSMFGLPAPIRTALEDDMRSRGIQSQRDYVLYLLLERERALRVATPITGAA